jgi:two-component system response regulator YesN
VEDKSMISAGTIVFYLTDLNTYIWDEKDGFQLSFERTQLPEFIKGQQATDLSFMLSVARQYRDQACMYTNELDLSYMAAIWKREEEQEKLFAIGPFLTHMPEMYKLAASMHLDQNKQITLEAFFRGLMLMGKSKIHSMASIVYQISEISQVPLHYISVREAGGSTDEQRVNLLQEALYQPDLEHADLIELRYKMEKQMMHSVEIGDMERLKDSFLKMMDLFDFSERYPGRPIRALKNSLLVLNTILRIAAEKGKVPAFFLHHLSEKFAIEIERLESQDMHQKLVENMCLGYCSLVKQYTLAGYSALIQKAVGYLEVNLGQRFVLERLASYCLVHPAHLSRQFKKETGHTLTDFLNGLRIREAKEQLRLDRSSIEEIASRLGFEDPAYFARVFKKQVGMTPSQYRNSGDA